MYFHKPSLNNFWTCLRREILLETTLKNVATSGRYTLYYINGELRVSDSSVFFLAAVLNVFTIHAATDR